MAPAVFVGVVVTSASRLPGCWWCRLNVCGSPVGQQTPPRSDWGADRGSSACVSNCFASVIRVSVDDLSGSLSQSELRCNRKDAVRNSHYFGMHTKEHTHISGLRKEALKSAALGKALTVSLVFINSPVNLLGVFFEQLVLCRSLTQTKSFTLKCFHVKNRATLLPWKLTLTLSHHITVIGVLL